MAEHEKVIDVDEFLVRAYEDAVDKAVVLKDGGDAAAYQQQLAAATALGQMLVISRESLPPGYKAPVENGLLEPVGLDHTTPVAEIIIACFGMGEINSNADLARATGLSKAAITQKFAGCSPFSTLQVRRAMQAFGVDRGTPVGRALLLNPQPRRRYQGRKQ